MLKVIVTGATGFIGKHLCKALLDKGVLVYGIGRNERVLLELGNYNKFFGLKLSFDNYSLIETMVKERNFDVFFHLANHGVNGVEKENYKLQLENTKIACDMVAAANALGCKRFVFIGSVDEFEAASAPDKPYVHPTHSKIYGSAKLAAESIGKVLAEKYSIEYVTALLALTYGEDNKTNILPNVIIRNSISKTPVRLIKGDNYFDMIYIDDAIAGILAIAEKGKNLESYFVGHEELTTFKEIVEEIKKILGSDIQLDFGSYTEQGNHIDYGAIDRGKLFRDTNYVCSTSLQNGISKTQAWLQSNMLHEGL